MSGPASLFLFAASAFAPSCLLVVPVPYMAPVATDFRIEIRSPLQDSNSCITSNNLFPSLTVLTYMDRSSAKAAWFHWGVLLIPCVIPVASSNYRSALRNKSKRRGERTEPCTVPVPSCMGVPTVIFIHDLLYSSSRKSTSGTPRPLRIAQRQECPSELKAFLKSKSILITVPHSFIACCCTRCALSTTICTPRCVRKPYREPSMTA